MNAKTSAALRDLEGDKRATVEAEAPIVVEESRVSEVEFDGARLAPLATRPNSVITLDDVYRAVTGMYLAEKGIPVPVGTLPVLELDDGRCLAESIAICRYLEELHPEPPLFGRTPLERAEIEMWTRRVEQYFYIPLDFSTGFARNPSLPEASKFFARWAGLAAGLFDQTVRARPFLAGDRLSMADVFAYGALDYGVKHRGYAIPAELASLQTWYASMGARPSASA